MHYFPTANIYLPKLTCAVISTAFALALFLLPQVKAEAALFAEYPDNPVFSYSNIPGTFDRNQIRDISIINAPNGEYWLYYVGLGTTNSTNVGLAKSSDGVHWERHSSDPVFRCGENQLSNCANNVNWSSHAITNPTVIFDEKTDLYKMWYSGDALNGPSHDSVGYATSPDGINWTAYSQNPIFPDYNEITVPLNGFGFNRVLEMDGLYYMYYTLNVSGIKTYVATSSDGVQWSVTNTNSYVTSFPLAILGVIHDKVYGAYNNQLYVSTDHANFSLVSADPVIDGGFSGEIKLEDGIVKVWTPRGIGNVTWSGGNAVLNYWTAPEEVLGFVNQPPALDPIGDQTVDEGEMLEFVVSASDADGDEITLSVEGLPAGAEFDSETGEFGWATNYADDGDYEVTFTVTDDGEPAASSSETITITVSDVPTLTEKIDELIEVVNGPEVPFLGRVLMIAHLNNVKRSVEDEKYKQAKRQMKQFERGVELAYRLGRISTEVRDDLIARADDIIADLELQQGN